MSEKRQQLIETATRLFAEHGFHATGIDRIAREAGVSKKTMYSHFRSKEELILAVLKHHDGMFRNFFMKSVDKLSDSPRERLLGIFDVAHAWFSGETFYGCMFINAISEYSQGDTPIRKACQDFKSQMANLSRNWPVATEIGNPSEVAAELALLLEGSIVTAQVGGTPASANTAKAAAQVLIREAMIS